MGWDQGNTINHVSFTVRLQVSRISICDVSRLAEAHSQAQKAVTQSNQEEESESPQTVHIPGMGLEGDLLDKIKGVGESSFYLLKLVDLD